MKLSSSVLALAAFGQLGLAKSLIQATYWPAYNNVDPSTSVPWNETSIAYYFVTVTTPTGMEIGPGQDAGNMTKFVTEAKSHNVTPVFTVGGWDGGIYFSDLVSSATNRTKFAKSIYTFAKKNNFEGIDIDWEYPNNQGIGCNTIRPDDAANYLLFLQELRTLVGKSYLITAATSIAPFMGPDGTPLANVTEYANYLDYINLMNYDLAGTWDTNSSSASPLGQSDSSCGSDGSAYEAVEAWTAAGFPASKILLGVPTYATGMTTLNSTLLSSEVDGHKTLITQPISSTKPKGAIGDVVGGTDTCGVYDSQYSGQYTYKQLVSEQLISSKNATEGGNGFTRYWDDCSQTPFLFNAKERHFISYEDEQSITLKAKFAKEKGLAGIVTFDSTGFTDELYQAIGDALGSSNSSSSSC